MPALFLVEVDLGLERLDLLCLKLQQLLQLLLLLHHVLLYFVVLVHEDRLVCRVQLAVKVQLLLAQLSDQVQQVSVVLYGLSKVPLCLLKVSISLLDHMDALLLCLVELVLQIKHQGAWSTDLQVVQINQVTEAKHLSLIVLLLPLVLDLEVIVDDLLLRVVVLLVVVVSLVKVYAVLIELTLAVNERQELSASEQH